MSDNASSTGSRRDPGDPHDVGVAAAAAVAGVYADDLLLGTVREVHRAVAGRVFAITHRTTLGSSRVPQLLHDGISTSVYAGLGAGLRAAAAGLNAVERRGIGPRLQERAFGTVRALRGQRPGR